MLVLPVVPQEHRVLQVVAEKQGLLVAKVKEGYKADRDKKVMLAMLEQQAPADFREQQDQMDT
jgi:hypothetical protein